MKEWMKELKLAKKRNLGIEVVARRVHHCCPREHVLVLIILVLI